MRLIVCGSRYFGSHPSDHRWLDATLDAIHRTAPIELVIEGGAQGADCMAAMWAKSRGIETVRINARWKENGKAAGPMRNREMLTLLMSKPGGMVVAFPGGRGTAHMVSIARAAGINVYQLDRASPA